MLTPSGTLQCIRAGPELQGFQGIRMRWWVHWCDVYGLRFEFLCRWKRLQGVPRLWFGISKSLAIRSGHRDTGCCPGSLAMEAETRRTSGGGTLQVMFHRIQRANPSSGANSLTTLSLGDVNAFVLCVSFFRLFLHNFLRFNLGLETPRSTLGSSCSTAKDHWRIIFLLGNPIHWDSSVLTLEFEGSFQPSMQVRRLALKCIVASDGKLQIVRRFLATLVWMTLFVFKFESVFVLIARTHAGRTCGSLGFRLHGSGGPAFGDIVLPDFGDFFHWVWHCCNAQGLRIEENCSHEIKICVERRFYRAQKYLMRLFQNMREGRGETKNLRLAKWL